MEPLEQELTLKEKLLTETARISWQELQPFFAKGVVIAVDGSQDLVQVAADISEDNAQAIAKLMESGLLAKLSDEKALRWSEQEPSLWAVVAAPWVVVQERD